MNKEQNKANVLPTDGASNSFAQEQEENYGVDSENLYGGSANNQLQQDEEYDDNQGDYEEIDPNDEEDLARRGFSKIQAID